MPLANHSGHSNHPDYPHKVAQAAMKIARVKSKRSKRTAATSSATPGQIKKAQTCKFLATIFHQSGMCLPQAVTIYRGHPPLCCLSRLDSKRLQKFCPKRLPSLPTADALRLSHQSLPARSASPDFQDVHMHMKRD